MELDFLGRSNRKPPREQRDIWKDSPVFFGRSGPNRNSCHVPFLQSHLWYQFRAFVAVFRYMELICTKSKRASGTKFTSPEFYLPFAQAMNQAPCIIWAGG